MNEKLSYTEYLVVGSPRTEFDVGFEDYQNDKDMLKLTVDNKDVTEAGYSVERNVGNTLVFTPAVPVGAVVRIQRITDIDAPFYIFKAGNAFVPSNVDANFKQVLHSQQEVRDRQDHLEDRVVPVVDGLEEALRAADEAAIAAKEAAVAAELAAISVLGKVSAVDSVDSLKAIKDMVDGAVVYVKSYYKGLNKGACYRVFDSTRVGEDDGFLCIKGWVLLDVASATPHTAGGIGDGVNDDTLSIQKLATAVRYINMRNANWYITDTIHIPSYRYIDMAGSNLHAECGNTPMFSFATAGEGLSFNHGGGIITGTAKSFLYCAGTTDTPTTVGHSARQIRMEGLYVVGANIEWFCDWQKAVRQVFFDKCHAYTKNCINANGKCIEIEGSNCIFFGATDDVTSSGFRLRATGGTRYYCEGFHFSDCTIDNYGITLDVADIYAMNITGGFLGSLAIEGCYAAKFIRPTGSTSCRDIKFSNVNIYGAIAFGGAGTGYDFHAIFNGCAQQAFFDIGISIQNNCSAIQVSNHRFHTPNKSNSWGIVCAAGNTAITINDIYCHESLGGCVLIRGASGAGCSVRNISYTGTGPALYTDRPIIMSGIPSTANTVSYMQKFNTASLQGAVALGGTIGSVSTWFAKGERGTIVCEISYTGATAGQILHIDVPSSVKVPTGSGWNSQFIPLNSASGRVSVSIPYHVVEDVPSGIVSITNQAGSNLYIDYHGFFGIIKS